MLIESVDRWLAGMRRLAPSGFLFQDLTTGPAQWPVMAHSPIPVLLRVEHSEISNAIASLVAEGLSPATPCALLAGEPGEAYAIGTAGDIAMRSKASSEGPQLLLLADPLPTLTRPELRMAGKTVMITRAQKQAGDLRSRLEREGARVLEAPAIEIVPKQAAIQELQQALSETAVYSWMVLTSVNTVSILDELLLKMERGWDLFQGLKIACIGTATANRVRELGGEVSLVPPKFQAESLAEQLLAHDVAGKRILLPRAEGSRRVLVEELERNGAVVREINIYRAEIPSGGREELQQLLQNESIDFITFTSSSTVHHFVEMAGDQLARLSASRTRIAAIGPITAATLREYGLHVSIEADEFTIRGLVEALAGTS